MVASVVVSHEAAVGGLSFGLLCKRLVRWRQRSSCARVRDRARAWARAQVVHRTTGTKVQAHRGTGAQGQACARGLKIGPQGFCCHGGQRDAVRGCGSLRYVLGSSLGISEALKNRAENMCPSEYVASYDNACLSRNVSFFCAGGWWMSTVEAVRKKKKQQATKCPCSPRSCLRVLLTNVSGGHSSVQEARGCAWEAARRTCFSHVSFSSGSFFWRAACIELAGVVECFSRSTFPRAHLVLRWHTNTYIHMLQVAHSLHMFLGGGT